MLTSYDYCKGYFDGLPLGRQKRDFTLHALGSMGEITLCGLKPKQGQVLKRFEFDLKAETFGTRICKNCKFVSEKMKAGAQ